MLKGESAIKEYSAGITIKHIPNDKSFQHLEVYRTNYRTDEFLDTEDGILFDKNYFDHDLMNCIRIYLNII